MAERVAIGYFAYVAFLGLFWPISTSHRIVLFLLPAMVFCALRVLEPGLGRVWPTIVREWAAPALILVGYWSLGWFHSPPLAQWQTAWLGWDRAILYDFGLKHAIESVGPSIPAALESLYFILYAIPLACLGILYACGQRAKAPRFLLILFLGTFGAYALLPFFPVLSPRMAFPGSDLPAFHGTTRSINTWLLTRLDITISVFPSGHVAVAFSSAFGLLSTRPRLWVSGAAFCVAGLVFVATIYGRYHYAVDGLASIVIAFVAWRVGDRWMMRA